MTIEMAFGIVIRRLRKERLLSQEELSRISCLDRGFISQLERGKQKPTIITIFELAAALNVSATRILNETDLLLWFNKVKLCKNDKNLITLKNIWEQFRGDLMKKKPVILDKETILVVDDEAFLLQFLSELLKLEGYNVITADDGQNAVNTYKNNKDRISLVLMDVMMPRKDGLTAHNEIKEFNPDAKILLMSAYSSVSLGSIERLNFIQKPMSPNKLLVNIRDVLDINEEIFRFEEETA